jgi:hypothetical protein
MSESLVLCRLVNILKPTCSLALQLIDFFMTSWCTICASIPNIVQSPAVGEMILQTDEHSDYCGIEIQCSLFIELEIKDTTDTDRSASYLDLHLEIDSEGWLRTKHYNKRYDFNFPTVN